MNKIFAVILGILVLSVPILAQSGPSSASPPHCSVEKGSAELPYPDSLRGSGIQGTVVLEAIIDEKGCTNNVRVVRKLHPILDDIAKGTVDSWKFKPATKDGKPVRVIVPIKVIFKDPGK